MEDERGVLARVSMEMGLPEVGDCEGGEAVCAVIVPGEQSKGHNRRGGRVWRWTDFIVVKLPEATFAA